MIPADAPPSFDAHREGTFATVHSAAPFYSLLIRVDPNNPSSTTDFVCDLCTAMPQRTNDGKTYAFKIRQGVKFHDGTPLTAADVAASWDHIIHPPESVLSPRESHYMMVDTVEAPDPSTVVFHLKFATSAFLPALADPFGWIYKKEILDKDPHWYETDIFGSGPFKFAGLEIGQSIKGVRNPDYYQRGYPISTALPASTPASRPCGSPHCAATGRQSSSAAFRPRSATSWLVRSATGSQSGQ
jgi:peptide/nickel transport system substrate-binding protein